MMTPFSQHLFNRLRFKQLALLVALDDHRNLHRAAQAVHLAQPSATKLIRDLEALFGAKLFERLPRGMQATEIGAETVAFARRILIDVDRFTQDLESKRRGGSGQLMVGAIMGAVPDVVAHAVADMKRLRPHLAIKLLGESSDEILNLLAQHTIDLAVGRLNKALHHIDIDYEVLGNDQLCLVVRRNHPMSHLSQVDLKSLARCSWVLQPLTNTTRQIVEDEFAEVGMALPADILECTSIFAILQLVQNSDAITVLPESVVRHHLDGGLLARLPVNFDKRFPGFGILTRRGEQLTAVAIEFVQALRHHRTLLEQPATQPRALEVPVPRSPNSRFRRAV